MNQTLARLDARQPIGCGTQDAASLAALIATYVKAIAIGVVATKDDIPECELDAFERKEWRERRAHWAQLKPARKKLCDSVRMTGVLAGKIQAESGETKGLRAVLEVFARRTQAWLRHYREHQEELRQWRERGN